MKIPKPINNLIESFQSLPGIGPKTAQRLTFHLLHFPQDYLERFSQALLDLKARTKICSICKNVGEREVCAVCEDNTRDKHTLLVVASPLDVFAVERTGYKGLYHVLHGLIDPLNGIGPEELFIGELIDRIKTADADKDDPLEVIIATNTSMEGESTAMYISKQIKDDDVDMEKIRLTRIARGLPVGGDIEYADEITLTRAIEGRIDF